MIIRLSFIIPSLIFFILVIYFAINLIQGQNKLPSMLHDKPVPKFSLPPLQGRDTRGLNYSDLKGEVSLVNIFGSWCHACLAEHPFLMTLKNSKIIPIHGIDWQEKNNSAGLKWLKKHGDPYSLVGNDPHSSAVIGFGVTGAPESFLVDKNGIIRHKVVGPINKSVWEKVLLPLIKDLKKRD